MTCTEALTTQALFDGELDGAAAVGAERHASGCAECSALLADLKAMRDGMKDEALRFEADDRLHKRLRSALNAADARRAPAKTSPRRAFFGGAATGAMGMAMAAGLALFLLLPSDNDELIDEVANAHLRSLVGNHLTDIASSDPAQIQGWLATHAGVAQPAPSQVYGYALAGARADYVYGAASAAFVYRRGSHVVNVFAWPQKENEETLPGSAASQGYNIVFWKRGNIVYCAISNLPLEELERFAQALGRRAA
jgi:anti-sigma factor RsiW